MNNCIKKSLYLLIAVVCLASCKPYESNEESQKSDREVLIKGAFFSGSNGVIFDSEDRLYVASVVSRLIGMVDTQSGEILDTLGQTKGIEGPDDLIFGPDGSMYFTSILTGEVGRMTIDGSVTKQFVSPGVNPITFSDDGRLFVALDFQGDGLYELDPKLKNPPRLIIKELGWLNGMDFGPDGYLYGPIWSKGHIVKIDVDKGTLEVVVDDLDTPAAVKFDSKGNLYTIDHGAGILYRINLSNGNKTEIASGFIGADNIAFNSKDELYMTHAQDGSIRQVYMDGKTRMLIEPALCNAADVEVVGSELIIPDILSLKKFSSSAGKRTKIYNHMIGKKGVIGPFTLDHHRGKLAMTSWFGNEVQVWDLTSNEEVSAYHDYAVPINAILDGDALIVAELGTTPGAAKVSRQNDGSREVLLYATGGLAVPSGLAARDGEIYVADYYLGKVYQVTQAGKRLDQPIALISDLQQPEGLQIAPNGNLLIVETGANHILSYDFKTKEKTVLVDNIPLGQTGPEGMPPTWKLSDVHFDKDHLYVPSDIENVVYKIGIDW